MMKIYTLFLVIGTSIFLQGCATYGKISGIPSENQKSIFKDGKQTLISVQKNTVIVAPSTDTVKSEQKGNFIISVNNGTDKNILFSTENISATASTKNTLVLLKVYSYADLVDEEKERQNWAALAAGLQSVSDSMNAANAGHVQTYGTYSGSAYSTGGTRAYGYGSYSDTTYDSTIAQAAQDVAQAKSETRFAQLATQGQGKLNALSSSILKKETLFPGAWHSGLVKIQLPKITDQPQLITLIVDIAGERHSFKFKQVKIINN